MVKHFREKVPEQADVGLQVAVAEAGAGERDKRGQSVGIKDGQLQRTYMNPKVESIKLHCRPLRTKFK